MEVRGVRVALDAERVERLAEPAAVLAGRPAAGRGGVRDRPGHGHRRAASRPRVGRGAAPPARRGAASRAATDRRRRSCGVGARWPVRTRWAVERCAGSSWLIDRTIASRCVRWRQQREVLADPDARRAASRSAEAAADLGRRVGLRVPGVELARTAPHGRSGCTTGRRKAPLCGLRDRASGSLASARPANSPAAEPRKAQRPEPHSLPPVNDAADRWNPSSPLHRHPFVKPSINTTPAEV